MDTHSDSEYEICDDNGVIHGSNSKEEMRHAYAAMTGGAEELMELGFELAEAEALVTQYTTEWKGDLKLVHVLSRIR